MPGSVAPLPAPQPLQLLQAVPSQAAGVTGPSSAPAKACRPRHQAAKPMLQPAKGQGGTKKRDSPAARLRTTESGVSKPTPRPRRACTSRPAVQPHVCPQGPPPAARPLQQLPAVPSQDAGMTGPSAAPAQASRPRHQAAKPALQPAKGQGGTKKRGSPAARLRTTESGVSKPTPRPRKACTSRPAVQPRAGPQGPQQRATTRLRLAAASQSAAQGPAEGQQRRLTAAEQFAALENHGKLSACVLRPAAAGAASRSCRGCQRRW